MTRMQEEQRCLDQIRAQGKCVYEPPGYKHVSLSRPGVMLDATGTSIWAVAHSCEEGEKTHCQISADDHIHPVAGGDGCGCLPGNTMHSRHMFGYQVTLCIQHSLT